MKKKLKPTKKQLRDTADELWRYAVVKKWGQDCEVCGKIGVDVHHFFPRNQFGILRFNINNGIVLCRGCHFEHHFKANPTIHIKIIKKRGNKWLEKLTELSKQKKVSFQTVKWYNNNIEQLREFLEL